MRNEKCIFESDELKHLCDMVKCPPQANKDKCVTRAYCSLVEDYVKVKEELKFFGQNNDVQRKIIL